VASDPLSVPVIKRDAAVMPRNSLRLKPEY